MDTPEKTFKKHESVDRFSKLFAIKPNGMVKEIALRRIVFPTCFFSVNLHFFIYS
jgi:hypothetical protein